VKKLREILPTVLQRQNLTSSAKSAFWCEKFRQFLVENFGKEFAAEISNLKFKNGQLFCATKNSAAAHQIFLRQIDFLEKFPAVKKIRVTVA